MAKKDVEKMQNDAVMYYKANGGNMKQAMIDAGYAETTATRCQHRLLKKVGEQIKEAQKEINSPKIKSIQEIQEWWASKLDNPDVEMKDQVRCSELLAKSIGAFVEQVKVSGSVSNPLSGLSTSDLKKMIRDD